MASQLRQRKSDNKDTDELNADDKTIKDGKLDDGKNKSKADPNIVVEYISAAEVFQAIGLLLLLSTVSGASKASLNPLYGPVLSANWFRLGSFISIAVVSLIAGRTETNNSSIKLLRTASSLCTVAPSTINFVAQWVFDLVQDPKLGPLGPLVVHCTVAFPIIGLGGAAFLQWMNRYVEPEVTQVGLFITTFLSWFALANCIHYVETVVWAGIPWIHLIKPSFFLIGCGFLGYMLPKMAFPASFSTPQAKKARKSASPPLAIVGFILFSTSTTLFTPSLPAGFSILKQSYSTSGFLQVGENRLASPPYRYFRRNAGVLGGVWLDGEKAGESISTSATLLDAARLVSGLVEGKERRALVLGLGTGVTASSLVNSSFNTTIIESDARLRSYATKYFSLPQNHITLRTPASRYIAKLALEIDPPPPFSIFDKQREELAKIVKERGESAEEKQRRDALRYDVVVHDLIWGGAGWSGEEAEGVWIDEFWENVKVCLREEGIVAVNLVSEMGSFHMQSVLTTLLSTFPTCHLYHASDSLSSPPSSLTDYVIFCSLSSNPLTFRTPKPADFSPSTSKHRIHTLTTLSQRKIPIEQVFEAQNTEVLEDGEEQSIPERKAELVLKTNDVRWKVWKVEGATKYWNSIRSILPSQVWKIY